MSKNIKELMFEADKIVVEECYRQRSKCIKCKFNKPTDLYMDICDAVTFIVMGIEVSDYKNKLNNNKERRMK